jgi:mono/diheme cytochrome c family protein
MYVRITQEGKMKIKNFTLTMLCATVLGLSLTGCNSSRQDRVTGVASVGAPIIGAVSLQDSSEPAQIRGTTTSGDGSFAFEVNGLRPPFALKVEWTDITGHHRMYSFAEDRGTANINPFSNAVFAGAAGISDGVLPAGELEPALIRSVAARHREVAGSLRTVLAPLFELYQTDRDPVTDEFEADHTGLDAMFDDVRIYVSSGRVIVRNNRTSDVIFEGPADNIASGTFYRQCMPGQETSTTTADGAALYANKCGSCHGQLAASRKKGATADRIQSAITADAGGMGYLSTLTPAEVQAIADALATTSTPPATQPTTPATPDGAALYADNCGNCHRPLATSGKGGRTATQIDSAIKGNAGGMGYLSTLTAAEIQAIADALATISTPPPAVSADGTMLYASWCGSCHNVLATSSKGGRTATQIDSAIKGNAGGMGYLSTLTAAEIQAIADALATTSTPPPACGSCHTIPPSTGRHTFHRSRATCATCHGAGYSTTAVNSATHANGVVNIASTPGWNPTTRSCSNSCHGSERW